jgi:hypothetical protein
MSMLRRHGHEYLTASQVGLAAATDDTLTLWAYERPTSSAGCRHEATSPSASRHDWAACKVSFVTPLAPRSRAERLRRWP